jgi:hypothetical protein
MEEQTQPEKPAIIEEAQKNAERLEKANMDMRELLQKLEKLEAFKTLGGKSELTPQEKPKEISPQEYAQMALRGELKNV